MAERHRTPGPLEPYLTLPTELSLILLTSTLECSADWVTARFAAAALTGAGPDNELALIIASWSQDERSWRNQLRTALGMDISRIPSASSFTFIDRLREAIHQPQRQADAELQHLEQVITTTLTTRSKKAVLILDQPDILLATNQSFQPQQFDNFLLKVRSLEQIRTVILSCTADLPVLGHRDEHANPLESHNVAFLVQQAHMADRILSCRPLKTGSARDVSGIIRITHGGALHDTAKADNRDLEKRYIVQRDGNVKIVE